MRVWRTNDARAAIGLLGRATALLPPGRACRAALGAGRSRSGCRERREDADAALAGGRARRCAARGRTRYPGACRGRASPTSLLSAAKLSLDDAVATVHAVDRRRFETRGDERGLGRAEICLASCTGFACNLAELGSGCGAGGSRTTSRPASRRPPASASRPRRSTTAPTPVAAASLDCAALLETAPRPIDRSERDGSARRAAGARRRYRRCARPADHARDLYEDIGNERAAARRSGRRCAIDVEHRCGRSSRRPQRDRPRRASTSCCGDERSLPTPARARCSARRVRCSTSAERRGGRRYRRRSPSDTRSPSDVLRAVPLAQPRGPAARARGRARRGRGARHGTPSRSRRSPTRSAIARRAHLALAEVLARGRQDAEARRSGSARAPARKGADALSRASRPGRDSESLVRAPSRADHRRLSRLRRRHHRAGMTASAWRTSFRAPTVERSPNGPVTAP